LLIEDLPGTGKSTLSKALAKYIGLKFKNVHFTNDLLPSDLIGINIFSSNNSSFKFEPGPIFTNVLLADEINRASPRTQSALLEAMNNKVINVDGEIKNLPSPFFVVATQNPINQIGTSPLPESQLDRFLMRISLGKPNRESEIRILKGENINPDEISEILSIEDLTLIQADVKNIFVSDEIYGYILDLITESRKNKNGGLSTRAGIGIISAAKSCAYLKGEDSVFPEHVKFIFNAVTEHRLDNGFQENESISEKILKEVDAIR
jgi:MoxR-like ATPase